MNSRQLFIFGFLLFSATFLFFYNLSWGAPFFFHPDERNIAYSVSGLNFPYQLNPHFFAYGSLPIYSIYIVACIKSLLLHLTHVSFTISFEDAIISSRIISSLLSVSTIILLYLTGKKLHGINAGLLSAFLGVFSVGFIQFAHFGTFEMWLTFFYLLLFYQFFSFIETKTTKNLFYLSLVTGILISIKISAVALIIIPLVALYFLVADSEKKVWCIIKHIVLLTTTICLMFFITNPFVLFDFTSFTSSIQYESNVATGAISVFYTGGFLRTFPVLYQLVHVYPFILNPVLLIIGIFSFIFNSFSKENKKNALVLLSFFLIYFLSQAFLFVKWTRYLIPTLPFIYLSISILICNIKQANLSKFRRKILVYFLFFITVASSVLWGSAYFITSFVHPDTRITAAKWAHRQLPVNSTIVTEAYDPGTLPFLQEFPSIKTFNFYDLDSNTATSLELAELMTTANYIILPSQRIIRNRINNAHSFPVGNSFYKTLQNTDYFTKIYETPCDIFCKITYLGDPIFRFEETASVFERPTLLIYRKK